MALTDVADAQHFTLGTQISVTGTVISDDVHTPVAVSLTAPYIGREAYYDYADDSTNKDLQLLSENRALQVSRGAVLADYEQNGNPIHDDLKVSVNSFVRFDASSVSGSIQDAGLNFSGSAAAWNSVGFSPDDQLDFTVNVYARPTMARVGPTTSQNFMLAMVYWSGRRRITAAGISMKHSRMCLSN